jgi:hypothetical protein
VTIPPDSEWMAELPSDADRDAVRHARLYHKYFSKARISGASGFMLLGIMAAIIERQASRIAQLESEP